MSSLLLSSTATISSATAVTSSSAVPTASESLTVILRSTLEGTNDFFPFDDIASLGGSGSKGDSVTFKDLIEDNIDGSQEILLFDTGCQINGEADCTRACSDNAVFYGSLETFYNCAALASIAHWTQDVNTYYVNSEAEANASSIMGAGTLADFKGGPVLDSFIMCAQASCSTDGLAQPCHASIGQLSTETSSARDILDAMDTFCPDIAAEINPDIFGPGVLISYVLQVCFSSSLWAFLKTFTMYVNYTQKKKEEARKRPPQPGRLKRTRTGLNRIESIIWPDSSALSRTSIAVATTLVEFQEAQCWFVFAVQIASILAIVVNSQEGTFWGEIITNAGVAYHVSLNGILPIFLVQVCLHNEGIRNWHTFIGFYVEYILAIVAATQKVQFKDAFALFRSQNSIPACGGNPSPRTYCAATQGVDGLQLSFYPHPLLYKMAFLILDTVAILVLTTDQLAWTLRRHHRTKHIRINGHKIGRWPETHWTQPHWIIIRRWFWWVLEVAYLIVNILYMVSLLKVIKAESFAANRWSYGQIIAMTVWGPVIIKLFDLILSGPPRNGMKLNEGPPRLRIDNYINHRHGTSADDDFVVDEYQRRKSRPDIFPLDSTRLPGPSRHDSPDRTQKDGASQDTPQEDGPDPDEPGTNLAPRSSTLRFEEEGRWKRGRSQSP